MKSNRLSLRRWTERSMNYLLLLALAVLTPSLATMRKRPVPPPSAATLPPAIIRPPRPSQYRRWEPSGQLDAARKNVGRRAQVEYYESVDRESQLENKVKETKAEYDGLNARSFEYQTLKREAEGDKKLYEELVRRIREAGIKAE